MVIIILTNYIFYSIVLALPVGPGGLSGECLEVHASHLGIPDGMHPIREIANPHTVGTCTAFVGAGTTSCGFSSFGALCPWARRWGRLASVSYRSQVQLVIDRPKSLGPCSRSRGSNRGFFLLDIIVRRKKTIVLFRQWISTNLSGTF